MKLTVAFLAGCGFSAAVPERVPVDAAHDARDRDGVVSTEFRRAIDINDNAVVEGPHAAFPLLVAITDPSLRDVANGGRVASADGADIRFTADAAGTQALVRELEAYRPATGQLVAWVSVPSLAASTVIYMHYGDPAATPTGSPATIWTDAGYAGVWHLTSLGDAAGNSNAATATLATAADAKIAGGYTFGVANAFVDLGSDSDIDDVFAGGGSVEAWFYATSFGQASRGRVFDKGDTLGWSLGLNDVAPTSSLFFVHGRQTSYGQWNTPQGSVTLNTWHHVAVVYDRGNPNNDATLYVDGVASSIEIQAPAGNVIDDNNQQMYAGNRVGVDRDFAGTLDELRISSQSRTAGWFQTTYANQSDPSAFYTLGPEE